MKQNVTSAKPTVMVAPLNWGLGHATRCIPLIHAFLKANCKVIIAGEKTTLALIDEIGINASERLAAEFDLSRQAIKKGKSKTDEQHIIEVWASCYKASIDKMKEIRVSGTTDKIKNKTTAVQNIIEEKKKEMIRQLPGSIP